MGRATSTSSIGNNAIRKLVVAAGAVTTFAGAPSAGSDDGMGPNAHFNQPLGIGSDGAGTLYVADTDNRTIRKIVIATGAVTTLAGAPGQTGGAAGRRGRALQRTAQPRQRRGRQPLRRRRHHHPQDRHRIRGRVDRHRVTRQDRRIARALPASLNLPYGVAVLPTGELAIVELRENAIMIGHL